MSQRKWLIAIPILLILLALCAGMLVIGILTMRQLGNSDVLPWSGVNLNMVSAEVEETQTFDVPLPASLMVTNPCGGDVVVRAGSDDQIVLSALKRAWGANQEAAERALAKIQLDIQQDGSSLRLGLKDAETLCQGMVNRPPSVDFTLTVPAEVNVVASTEFGGLALEGTAGSAELRSQFGDVSVKGLQGALLVDAENGAVKVEDVHAGGEALDLSTSFGNVSVSAVSGDWLTVKSSNGSIDVDSAVISGTVSLTNDFGDVKWQGGSAQALTADSKNGKITLSGLALQGKLEASSDFGDISIENVAAQRYSAITKNGLIKVIGATGDVTAESDFGDVEVVGAKPLSINLSTSNGDVTFDGELGQGPHVARTEFGNVTLRLPGSAAFDFDLQTEFGEIDVDFPLTISGKPDEKHWQGQVNDGGPGLTASTNNGDITISPR